MASIQKNIYGPVWTLGWIQVATPGTPVNIMSVVDPSSLSAPQTPTPGTTGAPEYSVRAYQIWVQPLKFNGTTWVANTGSIYITVAGTGGGNRGDSGSLVAQGSPGSFIQIPAAPLVKNVLSPYQFWIDADTAGDGAAVTLFIY